MPPRCRPAPGFAGLWLLAMVLQLLLWFPWHPIVLRTGLDISYEYALNELYVRGVQFAGSLHPHGPFGFLKNNVYHPETFHLLIAARLALFGVFALLAARTASRWSSGLRWASLWIVLVVMAARYGEAFFMSLAVLAFLAFWSSVDAADRARWSPVVLSLALMSLMKFNFLVMSFALVVLMVSAALLEQVSGRECERTISRWRQLASALAWPTLYLAGTLLLWVAGGQDPTRILEFVVGRLRFSGGYAESHGLAGPGYQIVAFVAGGGVLWAVFTLLELRRSGIRALAPAAALAVWLALTAKHTFLRHDPDHAVHGAFQGLCAATIFGLMMLRPGERGAPPPRRWSALVAIAVMTVASLSLISYERRYSYGAGFFRHLDLPTTFARVARFVGQPSHLRDRHERALATIRRNHPLPDLEGTVDVYPWELSLVFAHGLRLDPRPSLGSHMADRPEVAIANARHLASPDGPDHVLFRVESLDHRYPSMDDGPSWPILVGGFQLRSAAGSHLVLDRSQRARMLDWGKPTVHEVAFGERLEVAPGRDRLVWLRADLVHTRRGRLVAAAWRAPIVYLSVELERGGERWYRLVPGVARAGFLLSPLVADNAGFIALLDGSWPQLLAADRVRALALHTEFGDGWYWEPKVHVEFQELTVR